MGIQGQKAGRPQNPRETDTHRELSGVVSRLWEGLKKLKDQHLI